MRVSEEVKKCVVYLGLEVMNEHQKPVIHFAGTGFLIGVRAKKNKEISFIYLVTAKHVEVELRNKKFAVRANTKEGKAAVFWFDKVRWFHHPEDASADVAVMAWKPPGNVDVRLWEVGNMMFDNAMEGAGVGVGTEVFVTGLFTKHSGTSKNLPIVRVGNIAMLPDEPVPTSKFGDMQVYLIEARSIGGLSGSPVFVHTAMNTLLLLGHIHGHWDLPPSEVHDAVHDEIVKSVNVGVAMVTPAVKVYETICQEELVKTREEQESHI